MQTPEFDTDSLRVPPHSIQAEQSVLGGLLIDNNAWDKIGDSISAADFYRYDHRLIFDSIVTLINQGKPADVITVFDHLKAKGKAEDGLLEYLNQMAQNTPSAVNIRRYAEIVRGRGLMRELIAAASDIADMAYAPLGRDEDEILNSAEARIFAIAQARARKSDGAKKLQPLLTEVVERVDELYNRADPNEITGIATGFIDLDRMTTGLQPGDLIIVAGRPSMGKTAFAVNIGENVAIELRKPVVIYSMEMGGTQLASRMLGSVGRLDQQRLRTGRLTDNDWPRLTHAIQKLNDVDVYIDDHGGLTHVELRARARRLARETGGLGLIIIDYLQLMSGTSKNGGGGDNRANEVAEISRALKSLAKELGCPVIALSQLNRGLEQRKDKRPIMSDLRESGAIEQDADVILFLYRDEVYNPDSPDKGTAEVIVGKQRNGPTGTVRLSWLGEHTKYENYHRSAE
jgi:replicative DNA helicase